MLLHNFVFQCKRPLFKCYTFYVNLSRTNLILFCSNLQINILLLNLFCTNKIYANIGLKKYLVLKKLISLT